jgi:Spy/CpxP family protein refolding chaperone
MQTTKARGEAAMLVAVVFLLGVVLGGLGTYLWGQRVWGMRSGPRSHAQVVADLTRELELSSEQEKQLAAITEDTQAKWRVLYSPLNAQREQIREQSRERIRAILTPEQQPKFDQFMQRLDEQRRRDAAR